MEANQESGLLLAVATLELFQLGLSMNIPTQQLYLGHLLA
jgi:hypothetical protein